MDIEKSLEFEKIKEIWMELAVTQSSKEKIKQTTIYLSESELRRSIKDTTDSKNMIEKCGTPPLANIDEIKEILIIAEKGDCFTPYQLERVEKVLVAVKRLKDYLKRGKAYENSLAYYEENLNELNQLHHEISRQIRGGLVDHYASKLLAQIRSDIDKNEEKMRQKADQIMSQNKECLGDNYSTFRNGRLCIPVKKEYKFKIAGSIIDKSTTGNTLFIEPVGVAKYFEELQLLKIEEENEVYRILYTLTGMVADSGPVIEENIRVIEKLDFIFSKGKLSVDLGGIEPVINTDRRITLKNARHPLMEREVNVPLQFEIGGQTRGIVITGPNTGGKTVAIKTVALNCMMAQCGLHITCEYGNISMNSLYLCDIGDGQNITENLSTFSAHIKNVLEIIEVVDKDSLVVMDELGSGTDPTEGMGIAIAILEELRKSRCLFLVTTHYPQVKEYTNHADDIVNARMTFDKETLQPTYQMVIGEAGESCAFYIANKLGMSDAMLSVAIKAAYGEEAVENYHFKGHALPNKTPNKNKPSIGIKKTKKAPDTISLGQKYNIGDSVMILPDKKIGIVCETINEKGVLRVQLPGKKVWINHKRVKLHVAASQLYPEDYDFSIIFDTVENRKARHEMDRKYTEKEITIEE